MSLFVNQENSRTKLQQRIAAELAEKAKKKALQDAGERPDGVEDSAFVKNTKKTTSLAWVWILIIMVGLAAAFYLAFIAPRG